MADKTTNYNLDKPLETENYDVAVPNANMDKIDAQMKTNADAAAAKIPNSLATTANQFLLSSAAGTWVVNTVAQIKTLLGLGSAAYTSSTAYATSAQGTTADGAIPKSLATTASQFLISSGAGTWVINTVAQIKTLLGLGSAAYAAIVNNLTTSATGSVLDASQGKALSDLVSSEATARSSADSAHAADLITDSDGAHGLKVESGTFTPAYGTTGVAPSSITYEGSTYGKYVKTGNVVHVQGKVQISAFTFGSGTGLLCLVGFPFAPSNAVAITVGDAENWSTNYPSSLIKMATNGTALFYCRPTANGPEGQMALANLSSAGSCIYFSGEYTV